MWYLLRLKTPHIIIYAMLYICNILSAYFNSKKGNGKVFIVQ